MTTPVFRCEPYGTRLTPHACGARYTAVQSTPAQAPACVGCDVGKAHSRGKAPKTWADGRPVVRLTLAPQTVVEKPPRTRKKKRTQPHRVFAGAPT